MSASPAMEEETRPPAHSHNPLVRYFRILGPGLVTGASDDDPSGIATYSIAGAAHGYLFLWTAVITFPLMAAIQLVCARIGLVTGRGLAGTVRQHYPRPLIVGAPASFFSSPMSSISPRTSGEWPRPPPC